MLSGYFNIRWLWDAYRVPTWMDFGFKNPPKSALGRLLRRHGAALGRLGIVLERLGDVLTRLGASGALLELLEAAKSSKNKFSIGFKEPEKGWGHGTGVASNPMFPPPKWNFSKTKP